MFVQLATGDMEANQKIWLNLKTRGRERQRGNLNVDNNFFNALKCF